MLLNISRSLVRLCVSFVLLDLVLQLLDSSSVSPGMQRFRSCLCHAFLTCSVAGYYTDLPGQQSCTPCPLGKQAVQGRQRGSSQCVDCLPGRFAQTVGTAECVPCNTGEYGNATGLTTCRLCSVGTYADNVTPPCLFRK